MPDNIQGVLAALLTPRAGDGSVDLDGVQRNIEFALAAGVEGFAVGTATGEYAISSLEERRQLTERAAKSIRGKVPLIICAGAGRLEDVVELGRHALRQKASAVLVPPPHFYPYETDDIDAFYREAARRIAGPVVVYNIPGFSTGIDLQSYIKLVRASSHIVGIQDGSGKLEMLNNLAARPDLNCWRLLGNDAVFLSGLEKGSFTAAVSGPAGVVPELVLSLHKSWESGDHERYKILAKYFEELLTRLGKYPIPWALKWVAQAREWYEPGFPLPLSEERRRQSVAFSKWFEGWWVKLTPHLVR